jgi:pimeloyl-ACP methyl ester carboxylesterase
MTASLLMKKKSSKSNATPEFDASVEHLWGNIKAPGAILLALEGRAPWEYGAALASWPLLRNAPTGDGHSVLVFPGLVAGDFSTAPMRNFLTDRGFDAHGWELGMNLGPREGVLESIVAKVKELQKISGRKVSLVGWSLGGVYAREVAKILPNSVRAVISMGTPFCGDPKATNAWRIYEYASGTKLDDKKMLASLSTAPPVPTTSIFSRTDGVVAWQCSVQVESTKAENIEVMASHVGLGLNPSVWYAVADRLAQAEGKWKKFDRSGWKQYVYRDPARSGDWF